MISANAIKSLRQRLGPLIKLTCSGPFYWDRSANKFVILQSYRLIQWRFTYYLGHAFELIFFLFMIYTLIATDIPDTADQVLGEAFEKDIFLIGLGFSECFATGFISCISSVCLQYQQEMATTLNLLLQLCASQTEKFQIQENKHPKIKSTEKLVIFITDISLIFPFAFALTFFLPMDPIRNMFESILELELNTSSPLAWAIFGAEIWGVLCYSGIATSLIFIVVVLVHVCKMWLDVFTPVANQQPVYRNGKQYFKTETLGKVSELEMVWMYRTMQICSRMGNEWIANLRIASHLYGVITIGVVAAFALFKTVPNLLMEGSYKEARVLMLMVLAVLVPVIISYVECHLLDELDSKWQSMKEGMLKGSRRNKSAYKAARSFGEVRIHVAHPFCVINNSTFMELSSVAVNRFVDLLLTFG